MRLDRSVAFVFRAYLMQGLADGTMRSVVIPTLASRGVAVAEFADLGAWGLAPWIIKFVWAPVVDRISPRGSGRLPLLAGVAEICGAVVLCGIALLASGEASTTALGVIWFGLNWFLALQDTATDAFTIDRFRSRARAGANAAMQLGHSLGTALLASWGLGWVAVHVGLNAAVYSLAVLLFIVGATTALLQRSALRSSANKELPRRETPELLRALGLWIRQPAGVVACSFALSAFIANAITSAVAAGFLFQRLAWDVRSYQEQLMPLTTVVSLMSYLVIFPFIDRFRSHRVLAVASLALGSLWALLGVLEPFWDSGGVSLILVYGAAEALFTALTVVTLYAALMNQCSGPTRATQFVFLATLLNLSRFVGTKLGAPLLDEVGYAGVWITAGAIQAAWAVAVWRWLRPAEDPDAT